MRKSLAILVAAAFVAAASAADGVVVDYDISGAESWDDYGDTSNDVRIIDVAALVGLPTGTGVTMNGIGWDSVTLATEGGSWLSEAKMYFDDALDPDGIGLILAPGAGDKFAGTATYGSGGIIDLEDNGIANIALPDGLLRLEFFEDYDDFGDTIDAYWLAPSTLQFDIVPEPAGLALLGLAGFVLTRRRWSPPRTHSD